MCKAAQSYAILRDEVRVQCSPSPRFNNPHHIQNHICSSIEIPHMHVAWSDSQKHGSCFLASDSIIKCLTFLL